MSYGPKSIAGLRVLVVEDEALIAEEIADRLTQVGCEILRIVDTGYAAVEAALSLRPDLILMDIRLKGELDGIQATDLIHQRFHVPVVYLTAHSDQATLQRAKASSAFGYVLKPFHVRNLLAAIEVAVDRFHMEREFEDNHLTYATILGSIADGVIATDIAGRVQFMNPVAERLTGWTTGQARGEPCSAVLRLERGDERAPEEDLVLQALTARKSILIGPDTLVLARNGGKVAVDGGVSCVIDSLGRLVGASVTLRDMSQARKAEADLKAIAEQLRAVVDTAADGVMLLDAAGTVLMFNPACERLFGYTAREISGRPVAQVLPLPLSDNGHRPVRAVARATVGRRRDQSSFPVEVSVGEASEADRTLFVVVVHDMSARRQLEVALLEAVERERRRFGADLHDGLGQDLTGLSLLLAAVAGVARANRSPQAKDLEHAHEVARHALESCHSIARGLSPIGGAEGGLIVGLRELAARLSSPSGPQVRVAVSEVSRLGLSPAATDHLYRIAQEALSNALKHAHARSITLSLDVEPSHVRLEICDDGQGWTAPHGDTQGLGLRTMQYRASMIGATFQIAEPRPHGVCIVCFCPQAA